MNYGSEGHGSECSMSFLAEIAASLTSSGDFAARVREVLGVLSAGMGMSKGLIVFSPGLDQGIPDEMVAGNQIWLSESHQLGFVSYRQGKTIKIMDSPVLSRAMETGMPMAVIGETGQVIQLDLMGSRKSDELATEAWADLLFIAVPIRYADNVLGAIGADWLCEYRPGEPRQDVGRVVNLLQVVAAMLALSIDVPGHARMPEYSGEFALGESGGLIGNSRAFRQLLAKVQRATIGSGPVLLLGESGVGKDMLAHYLHRSGPRSDHSFIEVNCATLTSEALTVLLQEDEGSPGLLDRARGGFIFLDEIGDLGLAAQDLIAQEILSRQKEYDIRLIAASSRNLAAMVQDGRFRKDLLGLLQPNIINVPPLRERKSDIAPLADLYVEHFSSLHARDVRRISTPAIDMLVKYHWPGNIRELAHCMERAVLLSDDGVIHGYNLPPSLQTSMYSNTRTHMGLSERIEQLECEMINEALKESGGNVSRAAEIVGYTMRMIGTRIQRYNIDYRQYRQ